MRRKRQVLLSSFLGEQTGINYQELDLSHHNITKIDQVSPFVCSQVQSLNLSNNKISSLTQMAQFNQLKTLDLSHNKISTCKEMLALKNLPFLSKLFFGNNPFLLEPIEEQFLELIIDKEIDIEILSFDLVQEVQNEEVKIIFLKNYLSKIDLHSELKKKSKIMEDQEKIKTDTLVEKVIPQFYDSITSPKLTNTIKKEVLTLKKIERKESFEDALTRSKKQKQRQIDQLINTIINIIHNSETFMEENTFMLEVNVKENTISFSPEKSPFKKSPKKEVKIVTDMIDKPKPGSKEIERAHEKERQKYKTPMTKKQTTANQRQNHYIKVVQDLQTDFKHQNRSPELRVSPSLSTIKCSRSKLSEPSLIINQQLTPEKIETIYFKTLSKLHPMFNLLYSPASSLNNEEKNMLLEALKVNHKENFIQLLKERWSNQNLMKELDFFQNETEQKIIFLEHENRLLNEKCSLQKTEYDWVDHRYRKLQDDFNQISRQYNQIQKSQKNKTAQIASMEVSYKKIKQYLVQSKQKVQFLQNCEEREEKIAQKHEQNLLQSYFKKITQKAALWKKVLSKEKKAQQKRKRQIYDWGMNSFITAGLFRLRMTKFSQKKEGNLVKNNFADWKKYLYLQKKQRLAVKKVKKNFVRELWALLRQNEAKSKLKRLKNSWALTFYKQKKQKTHFQLWKQLYNRRKKGQILAQKQDNINTQKRSFYAICNLIFTRESNMIDIYEKHIANKKIRQFERMIWLIQKQMVQNREKQHTVRICHQHELRRRNFEKMRQIVTGIQDFKQKCQVLNRTLKKTSLRRFKLKYKQKIKFLASFKKVISSKALRVAQKMMKREKLSFELNNSLLLRKKQNFIYSLRKNRDEQKSLKLRKCYLSDIRKYVIQGQKLKFLKNLLICRLKGRNFVKRVAIKEMNFQMDLNDQKALQLIKQSQQSLDKCESEIVFLKKQIQNQSARQMALMVEKDAMMITINQSHEIMVELGKEVGLIRQESSHQERKYNELARKYNEAVLLLERRNSKSPKNTD